MFDCINCSDCFGCWNLRNKKFQIFNVQYEEQEYKIKVAEYKKQMRSYQNLEILKQIFFQKLEQEAVFHYNFTVNTENTFGGYINNAKNTYNCYESGELEDCKDGLLLYQVKNLQDGNNSVDAQMQYEVSTGGL